MNMDYSAMWAVVDTHRRCADELEQTLREVTGDRPVPDVDKIELYDQLIATLYDSGNEFSRLSDREGYSVRRVDAARCRVFSARCDRARGALQRLGEL